jgi:hypothetical protein
MWWFFAWQARLCLKRSFCRRHWTYQARPLSTPAMRTCQFVVAMALAPRGFSRDEALAYIPVWSSGKNTYGW